MAGNGKSGNRGKSRGHRSPARIPQAQRRITIGDDIVAQLRAIHPDIQLTQFVEGLLMQFIISYNAPLPKQGGEKESKKMKIVIIGKIYGSPTSTGTVAPLGEARFVWEGDDLEDAERQHQNFLNTRREGTYSSYPRSTWYCPNFSLEENGATRYASESMYSDATIANIVDLCRAAEQADDIDEIMALCAPIDIADFRRYIEENWPKWRPIWNWSPGFRTGYPPSSRTLFDYIAKDYIVSTRLTQDVCEKHGIGYYYGGISRVCSKESLWAGKPYATNWRPFARFPFAAVREQIVTLISDLRERDTTPATQR